jgi:hypothetical protein
MSKNVRVFFLHPTDRVRVSLRRYVLSGEDRCAINPSRYHNSHGPSWEQPARFGEVMSSGRGHMLREAAHVADFAPDDPRWPTACVCGRVYEARDEWQVWQETIYRTNDGREMTWRDAPVGAMKDAFWLPDHSTTINEYGEGKPGPRRSHIGQDGLALVVKVPGTEVMPDEKASNCTLPQDGEHKCWVRHGDARKDECHVDKIGLTCAAGAGSFVTRDWHGFIHHNHVTDVPDHLA